MAVDPERVPVRKLSSGATMPAIGLGTFGSDRYSATDVATAVAGALEVGYRHFDCASVYNNEAEIGQALAGAPREQLWITSKLWNNKHAPKDVRPSCESSLTDLRMSYLDAYLVHWPFPNHHDPGVDVTSRAHNAKPYIHDEFMAMWREMERLVDEGLVRHIGTSNMTVPKLELLLRDARIRPAVNEMELHPHFQQPDLFSYCVGNGIQPIGFAPIGSPERPDRDKTPEDTVDIEDPVIMRIAKDHGVHPAVVCVKWAVQRGQIPIPFSSRRNEYESNLQSVVEGPLTDEEMTAIAGIDRNDRLIKGHVFLWREGQSWEDLWDLDGLIKT
ncbi:MAG TPA: aldo/keto reductase [Acidimicrobiales bacterium]|nr:aldo/keto reductase [Acidimicrobiales bacterium]